MKINTIKNLEVFCMHISIDIKRSAPFTKHSDVCCTKKTK